MGAFITETANFVGNAINYEATNDALFNNYRELGRAAQFEDANASAALRQGALQSGLIRTQGTLLSGTQRVAIASSGVDAGSGTAADVLASTDIWSELDASTARNNAYRAALGHKEVARKYRSDQAQTAKQIDAGYTKLVSSGITGVAKVGVSLIGGGMGGM